MKIRRNAVLTMDKITGKTQVEDIVDEYPQAVGYFIQQGVSPIFCVGAYPQCLDKLLELKGVKNPDQFIKGLNDYIKKLRNE